MVECLPQTHRALGSSQHHSKQTKTVALGPRRGYVAECLPSVLGAVWESSLNPLERKSEDKETRSICSLLRYLRRRSHKAMGGTGSDYNS